MEVREMTIEEIKVLLNRKNTEITLLTKNLTSTRGKLATAVEALEEIRGMAINNYHDMRINIVGGKVREALAEIGGEDE